MASFEETPVVLAKLRWLTNEVSRHPTPTQENWHGVCA
jgi:hypothetical protein